MMSKNLTLNPPFPGLGQKSSSYFSNPCFLRTIKFNTKQKCSHPLWSSQQKTSRGVCTGIVRATPAPTKVAGKRTDLKKIMILGAGPIVIGQACEFDYSGTQACKALREEGYEVVLINSNPATIMTDPDTANRTYITPLTPELVEQVIQKERPDALLPTMGGQTALNLAVALAESGVLEKYGVELIGAKLSAIKKAEDRDLFKQAMKNIGIKTPPSGVGNSLDKCIQIAEEIGEFPLIIRPAFTLGGTGGGIAYNTEEFQAICKAGLAVSLTNQVLVEKSLLGWKEYELEVMRDLADNVVIICSIENIDPMGVHTGDSITVAPAQTLTDKEYQRLRDYSVKIIREIGVDCGGSNVQFAVNPVDGEVMVIEMNPRVSRSSALASKATGFPIAKIAAKLSVGYSLDQIPNDITKMTPSCFEPSIDYVVTKIPRFAFEKFPGSQPILTTQMKSVGEAMAIGRTFQESFQKAIRSLETGYSGWGCAQVKELDWGMEQLKHSLKVPNPNRVHAIYAAMKKGMEIDEIFNLSFIDQWFLAQLKELVDVEHYLVSHENLSQLTKDDFVEVKKRGFSDNQIAFATKSSEQQVRETRISLGIIPAYKRVDTCAAEFEAHTPYMYSSYDSECESAPTFTKKVLILGSGPNRIGQGIESDYCCCHASFALQNAGYETIMMNSNPETVSTDYDTSDRLYFEPMTVEDVLNVIDLERPDGIIVQFGGQTALQLALSIQQHLDKHKLLSKSGFTHVTIWGTHPVSIEAAEDRERFNAILKDLNIKHPKGGIVKNEKDALDIARTVGYPVVARPSYVLGGRGVEIVHTDENLVRYIKNARVVDSKRPILINKFLSDAIEVDVDALVDSYGNVVIGGIMEDIEKAGVHSGDSACSIPTQNVSSCCLEIIRSWTSKLARRLDVCGLMNCQYAITLSGEVFLLEVNLRASRTVPFVSKAIGHPLVKYASLVMSGESLHDIGFTKEVIPKHVSVKEVVLPFNKFEGCDVVLGPEMKSTGEVMGIDYKFASAFAKAQFGAGQMLPLDGTVFLSSTTFQLEKVAKGLLRLGFRIVSTSETEQFSKMLVDGQDVEDMVSNGQIQLMVMIGSSSDGNQLRRLAIAHKVPLITSVEGALASVEAIRSLKSSDIKVIALQDFFQVQVKQVTADNLLFVSADNMISVRGMGNENVLNLR